MLRILRIFVLSMIAYVCVLWLGNAALFDCMLFIACSSGMSCIFVCRGYDLL